MAMQLKYGTYAFAAGGVKVASSRKITLDARKVPITFDDSIECDGFLEGVGQNALSTAEAALKTALALRNKDLVFLCDDGSQSSMCLLNAGSITGVRVTDGPHFHDVVGPEFVSQRHFKFTAEADYKYSGTKRTTIIEWGETLSFSGGGPLYVTLPALIGYPQRQMVYERTPCKAKQKGFAVGYGGDTTPAYPDPAPAIWPFALVSSPDTVYFHPIKMGDNYTNWRMEWEYTYEWPDFLTGTPTLWKG